jgi:hypothetical protein
MTDMGDVRERLARIETKIDAMFTIEPRVRKLENRQSYWSGAIAIGSTMTTIVMVKLGLIPHVG